MILRSDYCRHFSLIAKFKAKAVDLRDLSRKQQEDRKLLFSMGLKCADYGFACKSTELYTIWANLMVEEFFLEGDREKSMGLTVSVLCDRGTVDRKRVHLFLLNQIARPLYGVWTQYLKLPKFDEILENLEKNIKYWEIDE